MINPKALETFGKYDKKSLMAGVVVGQGLKGRARAPQTPAPAGFPQELWDDASERANAMIASLQGAGQSTATPETPDDWQFDKDAFCFGIAAGRSLEGWELDSSLSLSGYAKIVYRIHLDSPRTVVIWLETAIGNGEKLLVDWGDSTEDSTNTHYTRYNDMPYSGGADCYIYSDYHIEYISSGHTPTSYLTYRTLSDDGSLTTDGSFIGYFKLKGRYFNSKSGCIIHNYENSGDYIVTIISSERIVADFSNRYFVTNGTGILRVDGVYTSGVYSTDGDFYTSTSGIEDSLGILRAVFMEGNVSVKRDAFALCINLADVTLPGDIAVIGGSAFYCCYNLNSVMLMDGITEIQQRAFYYCKQLMDVVLPDSVTEIGGSAFCGCRNLDTNIPNRVTTIFDHAFASTGLTSVTIPETTTIIGNRQIGVFRSCRNLRHINVDEGNMTYRAENGVLFSFDGSTLLCYPAGKEESTYSIPRVDSLAMFAFEGCANLSSVTIPDSITRIESYAFRLCTALTSVTIPSSVTSIGMDAFYGCSSLSSVTIPGSVTSINSSVFYGCTSLTSVTIGSGVTSIGYSMFCRCTSLTSVTIPDSVTSIESYAFDGCSALTSVTIPSSVTGIGIYAFRGTRLTSVTISRNCSYGSGAFPSGCRIYYYS